MRYMEKNVEETVVDGLCTGCGTCVGMCPTSAIRIAELDGAYVPKINEEKCNGCGICFEVCPGHSVDFKRLNLELFGENPKDALMGNYIKCYVGHASDFDIRFNSASGGLVTSLLIFALENGIIDGALVTKMGNGNPLKPRVFIARTKREIISAAKSKYCPVAANINLREILNEDGIFAVVGLPCHIQGIRKAETINEKLKNKILLHFGLICNHSPTFSATEFLLRKMKLKKSDVKKIDYRGEGWPGGMSITLKNDRKYFVPESNPFYWGYLFCSYFFPKRCILCNDKICELSDISFGDAWHLSNNKIGESIVISRSKLGEDLLQKATTSNKIQLQEVDNSQIINSQALYAVKRQHKARHLLFRKLGKKVPTYNQKLLDSKISDYLRALLLYLNTYLSSRRYFWNLIALLPSLLTYAKHLEIPKGEDLK